MKLTCRLEDKRAVRMRTEYATSLKLKGFSYRAIGKLLGICGQRVHQLLRPPKQVIAEVLERAKDKCERCGVGPGLRLDIHHKSMTVAPALYNDPSNLMALCKSCHGYAHEIDMEKARALGALGNKIRAARRLEKIAKRKR